MAYYTTRRHTGLIVFSNYDPYFYELYTTFTCINTRLFFSILRKRLRCYIVLFFRSFDPSSLVRAALLLYIWIFCRIFPSNYVFNKPLYIALYTLYIIHTHTSKCGINAIPILELNHEWDLQMTVYCTGILFWRKESQTQGKIYTYKTTGKISKVQLSSFSSITVLKFEVPKWKWKAAAIKHVSLAAGLKSLAPGLKKIG